MPTLNAPFGMLPHRNSSAAPYALQTTRYFVRAANTDAFYIGSPVKLHASADAFGVAGVTVAAGTDALVGAVTGVEPVNVGVVSQVGGTLGLETVSVPATKARDYYVYVADDPMQIFEIQGDSTATNQIAGNANLNCSLTIAAPSPATAATSATVVSSSTIASTNTLNIRLMGLVPVTENSRRGFGAFSVYKCKINAHQYANLIAGV